jgi:putative hemolysin
MTDRPNYEARADMVLTIIKGSVLAMLGGCALVLVSACTDMTQPEDVAIAEELCAKRGGYSHAARFERGKVLTINCKDGTHIDVRPGDRA